MKRVKSVTAHVVRQTKDKSGKITFRLLITVLEVVAAVLVILPPELLSADKIATAAAIGGLISIVINIIKESGLMGGASDGA
jgi:hypothetical protein